MLTQKEIIEILKRNSLFLKQSYNVKRIGLFGSYIKGLHRKDSDVDILLEFEKPIGLKFMELAEYLENQLGRKVDILTPQGIRGIRVRRVAEDIKRSMVYV